MSEDNDTDGSRDVSTDSSTDAANATDGSVPDSWGEADFQHPETGVPCEDRYRKDRYMPRKAGEKMGYAVYGQKNHPSKDSEKDDRYKWKLRDNWRDGDTMRMVQDEPEVDGQIYIHLEEDPFVFVDIDDGRCPETGAVHPEIVEILNRLGLTYANVSLSGAGVHAIYRGDLPNDKTQATFAVDDEPWGANDKIPEVEIYDADRICAATWEHVPGTPTEARELNETELAQILDEHDELENERSKANRDLGGFDPNDYDPEVTDPDETTQEIKDVYAAVERLHPRSFNVGVRHVGQDSTGWDQFDPSMYRASAGKDSLHYNESAGVFYDHKKGEAFGVLDVVATAEGIISKPWHRLEGKDWLDAVEAARERGASIPKLEQPTFHATALLPLERLSSLSHQQRKEYARRNGIDWPAVGEVREQLQQAIEDAMGDEQWLVQTAPTGTGKSYAIATEEWRAREEITGGQPVIHCHATTDARDEAQEESREADVRSKRLLGRDEACPLCGGAHDPGNEAGNEEITIEGMAPSEWFDQLCSGQGMPFSVAHSKAEELVDVPLPCQRGETDCLAKRQFDDVPRTDSGEPKFDVLHCTHQFLFVPSLRLRTNLVIDEKPSFIMDLAQQRAERAIEAELERLDAPVQNVEDLKRLADGSSQIKAMERREGDGLTRGERFNAIQREMDELLSNSVITEECPECGGEGIRCEDGVVNEALPNNGADDDGAASNDCPQCDGSGSVIVKDTQMDAEYLFDNPDAHVIGPALVRAIWTAQQECEGRKVANVPYKPPRYDDSAHDEDGWNRNWLDVVFDEVYNIQEIKARPDLGLARSVIGLDAHAQHDDPHWQADVSPSMHTNKLLDSHTRALYRRYERGLFTVQVGDNVQPTAGAKYIEKRQGRAFTAVINLLRQHYGEAFDSAISSNDAERHIREAMRNAGIRDPDTMHFGEEESRNDFDGKQVGLVAGSVDPGDNPIINLCARLGYDVKIPTVECPKCGGSGAFEQDDGSEAECQHCEGEGEFRERGRTFEGPDADQAKRALKGIREHHVAQSAGRWARNPDDPDDHATVFVMTNATPEGFIDVESPGVEWTTNKAQKERLEFVRDQEDGTTAGEIAEACDCTERTARRTMAAAAEHGLVEKVEHAGVCGAHLWMPTEQFNSAGGGGVLPKDGDADEGRIESTNTYTVRIDTHPSVPIDELGDAAPGWDYQLQLDAFEPPAPGG